MPLYHFTKHAIEKFEILARHQFPLTQSDVLETIQRPDFVDAVSRYPLVIYQRSVSATHVLRVVTKQEDSLVTIITFYPGRVSQYEP